MTYTAQMLGCQIVVRDESGEIYSVHGGREEAERRATALRQGVNERAREVLLAQNAIRKSPDTRFLKRECARGNPYVRRFLAARGLRYDAAAGAIVGGA